MGQEAGAAIGGRHGLALHGRPQARRLRRPAPRPRGLTSAAQRQRSIDAVVGRTAAPSGAKYRACPTLSGQSSADFLSLALERTLQGRFCTANRPGLPRSRHSTVQSGPYFAAILIAHLLGSRELLPGLARLWMWISLLSPHCKAASQLFMEQVSFGGSERVLQARFEARKQIAERPLGANRG